MNSGRWGVKFLRKRTGKAPRDMIFKYESISHNVRGTSQCTGSIMGIFLLCSGESKKASVTVASERVERGARGHQRRTWPDGRRSSCTNVRTVAFT